MTLTINGIVKFSCTLTINCLFNVSKILKYTNSPLSNFCILYFAEHVFRKVFEDLGKVTSNLFEMSRIGEEMILQRTETHD